MPGRRGAHVCLYYRDGGPLPPARHQSAAFYKLCSNYEPILRRRVVRLCFAMLDISGDALGWLLAIGFALVFAVIAAAVAYHWSRAN
jgi:hypothetical protein